MIVVSDASPIIGLAAVEQLPLLRALFGEVFIPETVFQEIDAAEDSAPGVREVRSTDWIRTWAVEDRALVRALSLELDPGEAEAIALAIQTQADLLLMDERRGRAIASRLGVTVLGALGVLVRAKERGRIEAVRPVLESLLKRAGFRISQGLYERVLRQAGEAAP